MRIEKESALSFDIPTLVRKKIKVTSLTPQPLKLMGMIEMIKKMGKNIT